MRSPALLLAASLAFLTLAPTGSAHRQTTAPGGYLTVRVIVTDKAVTVSPKHAPRGSTAIFLLSNHTTSSHAFVVGDASVAPGRSLGFAAKLAPNEQKRVLMYLDYRGPLPFSIGDAGKTKVLGVFWVT